MRTQNHRVEELLWRRFESDHRRLERVLDDVRSLATSGSFETARKRFGEYRLRAERHRLAENELLAVCKGDRTVERFAERVRRERRKVLEQSDRIWMRLCRERLAHAPRMLARLNKLAAQHELAERQLILAELPLSPARRRAHGNLLRHLRSS